MCATMHPHIISIHLQGSSRTRSFYAVNGTYDPPLEPGQEPVFTPRHTGRISVPIISVPTGNASSSPTDSAPTDSAPTNSAPTNSALTHQPPPPPPLADDCPICISAIKDKVELPCGHLYCRECLLKWFVRSESCCMCRAHVGGADLALIDTVTTADIGAAYFSMSRGSRSYFMDMMLSHAVEVAVVPNVPEAEAVEEMAIDSSDEEDVEEVDDVRDANYQPPPQFAYPYSPTLYDPTGY